MQALVDSHLFVNRLTIEEFLRTAYYFRFGRDITHNALTEDSKQYNEGGKIPPYVISYILFVYGDCNERYLEPSSVPTVPDPSPSLGTLGSAGRGSRGSSPVGSYDDETDI